MNRLTRERIWNKQFFLIVFINTAVFLSFNMATAGFPAYVAFLGNSSITTGMVTAVSAISALLMRPFAGAVLDNKNDKLFPLIGILLLSSPILCMISSRTSTVIIVRFLQGAGWGITSTACSKLIANSLPSERLSEGIGYAGVLSSVATAFAPGIAIAIFEKYGSGLMFGTISASSLITVIVFLAIKTRGNEKIRDESRLHVTQIVSINAIAPALLMMTITITYAPMVTFITPYAQKLGISGAKIFFLAYAFSTILARPLTGIYVDRKNTKIPTIIALATATMASVSLAHCNSIFTFAISGILAGIGTGAGMNSLQTDSIKRTIASMRGAAIATFLFGFDLGMAIGSFTAGMILKSVGFTKMFTIMSFPPIIAIISILLSMMIRMQNQKDNVI